MIEVSGISKRYGELKALDNVSFKVDKGKIVGFLGANGAGKTTTMDILCGCIGADEGSAKISGFDITESPIEAKRRLGYLPDTPPLYAEMQVEEYIEYAAMLRLVSKESIPRRLNETIEKLSLGDVRKRLIGNLSKGYRQRVALAQALVHDPEVLVLDEPTEGLDPNQIIHIRELIQSLKSQHTIILSSHILSEVENMCESIVIINQGKIVTEGTYSELVSRFSGNSIYHLKVAHRPDELLGKLEHIAAITQTQWKQEANSIEFMLREKDGEKILDDIARAVIDGGHGLRELAQKTKSLEDIFIQITH